jgi:hypothetical protein
MSVSQDKVIRNCANSLKNKRTCGQLLLARNAGQMEEPTLSAYVHGGDPPGLRLWGVTSHRFASKYQCYLTATLGRQKHLEGSLTSSVHTGGLYEADIFPPLPAHTFASVAWIQDVRLRP